MKWWQKVNTRKFRTSFYREKHGGVCQWWGRFPGCKSETLFILEGKGEKEEIFVLAQVKIQIQARIGPGRPGSETPCVCTVGFSPFMKQMLIQALPVLSIIL